MSKSNLVVFDVDGVLIDSDERYLRAVAETCNRLLQTTRFTISDVQRIKWGGGLNDDLDCIRALTHKNVPDAELLEIYLPIADFLWMYERWLPQVRHFLTSIQHLYQAEIGIFTSRPRKEFWASVGVYRDEFQLPLDHVTCMEDVGDCKKPHPDGLLRLMSNGFRRIIYVGDMVDDFQAAQRAGVTFVGIARTSEAQLHLSRRGAPIVLPCVDKLLHENVRCLFTTSS